MTVTLPPALNQLVERLVRSGRYADEADVLREALRILERQEFDESPALEAAILEGLRSPHQPYDASIMHRIRQSAGHKNGDLHRTACRTGLDPAISLVSRQRRS